MTRDPPPHRPRRRVVTPEEARVWQAVVRDVAPLAGRPRPSVPPADPPPPDAPAPPARPSLPPAPLPRLTAAGRATPLQALQAGRSPGLDKRSAERLKRGEMTIDATLDLHGLTQDAAHMQLLAFVGRAFDAGRRCLLVVTGKGRDGGGVLRGQVPRWLNQPGLRERILGFCHARPHHGGEGALYVLVKRRR